jgi:hypothetical protein
MPDVDKLISKNSLPHRIRAEIVERVSINARFPHTTPLYYCFGERSYNEIYV